MRACCAECSLVAASFVGASSGCSDVAAAGTAPQPTASATGGTSGELAGAGGIGADVGAAGRANALPKPAGGASMIGAGVESGGANSVGGPTGSGGAATSPDGNCPPK